MTGRAAKGKSPYRRSILTIMFVRDSCSKQLDSDRLAADVPDLFVFNDTYDNPTLLVLAVPVTTLLPVFRLCFFEGPGPSPLRG